MPLQAPAFFQQVLDLPFEGTVIGDSYYTKPDPASGLRLRIDFYATIRLNEYGGLRATVLHPDRGTIDTVLLSFADHGTFTARDQRAGCGPRTDGYGVIRDWHRGAPPWAGGDFTSLRRAVTDYARLWLPTEPADQLRKQRALDARQQSQDVPAVAQPVTPTARSSHRR
ncbi:hypothetical protein ACWGCC_03925 [Streptomyces nigrescens]